MLRCYTCYGSFSNSPHEGDSRQSCANCRNNRNTVTNQCQQGLPLLRLLQYTVTQIVYDSLLYELSGYKLRVFNTRIAFSPDNHQEVMPINRIKRSLLPNYRSHNHVCGRRYRLDLFESFRDRFPVERLCVSLTDSDEPEALEKKELKEYCKKFGELPPLNRME